LINISLVNLSSIAPNLFALGIDIVLPSH